MCVYLLDYYKAFQNLLVHLSRSKLRPNTFFDSCILQHPLTVKFVKGSWKTIFDCLTPTFESVDNHGLIQKKTNKQKTDRVWGQQHCILARPLLFPSLCFQTSYYFWGMKLAFRASSMKYTRQNKE